VSMTGKIEQGAEVDLMITELLQKVLRLAPPGQRIISITEVRDGAILVTDHFVYQVRPEPRQPLGFTVQQLYPIY
jgi:hypothetical protein